MSNIKLTESELNNKITLLHNNGLKLESEFMEEEKNYKILQYLNFINLNIINTIKFNLDKENKVESKSKLIIPLGIDIPKLKYLINEMFYKMINGDHIRIKYINQSFGDIILLEWNDDEKLFELLHH